MTCAAPEREWQPFLAAGTLTEPDRRAAEAHAAACPECAQELRAARELVEGLRTLHLTGEEVAEAAGEGTRPAHIDECPACAADVATLARVNMELGGAAQAAEPGGSRARPRRLVDLMAGARVTLPALAALLLVSITAGVRLDRLADENRRLAEGAAADLQQARRERDEAARRNAELQASLETTSRPQVNVPIVNLEPAGAVRGDGIGSAPPEIPHDASSATLVLHLLDNRPGRTYRAAIVDAGGGTVWQGDGLATSAEGTLSLGMPMRLLPPGTYRLRLFASGRDVTAPIETYAFRVR